MWFRELEGALLGVCECQSFGVAGRFQKLCLVIALAGKRVRITNIFIYRAGRMHFRATKYTPIPQRSDDGGICVTRKDRCVVLLWASLKEVRFLNSWWTVVAMTLR
jgi:hypothetical protein